MTTRTSLPNEARCWADLWPSDAQGSTRFSPAQFELRANYG